MVFTNADSCLMDFYISLSLPLSHHIFFVIQWLALGSSKQTTISYYQSTFATLSLFVCLCVFRLYKYVPKNGHKELLLFHQDRKIFKLWTIRLWSSELLSHFCRIDECLSLSFVKLFITKRRLRAKYWKHSFSSHFAYIIFFFRIKFLFSLFCR